MFLLFTGKNHTQLTKYFLSLLLMLVLSNAISQSSQLPDPQPYFSAVIVSDIDTSIKWYSLNLGFKELNKVVNTERGFKQANLKCGNSYIELIELDNSLSRENILKDQNSRTRIDGFFKIGFHVENFDQWMSHLRENKVAFRGEVLQDQITGKRMIIFLDPDGNRIQLFGD